MSGQIDRWWATAGQGLIPVTWTVNIGETNSYRLDIDIEGFITQRWDLSSSATVEIRQISSTPVTPESVVTTAEFSSAGVADLGLLQAGTYEFKVSGFIAPESPVVEKVDFQLEKWTGLGYASIDSLNALFIADHPDGATLSIDRRLQYETWIDQYAPILLFDAGITGETTDDERFAVPFNINETWGKYGTGKLTGDTNESISLSSYENGNYNSDNTTGAIYASVLERGDEVAIDYYFHYPRSNWGDYRGFNTHQGDWEGITVFLKNGDIDRVAYSQHLSSPLSGSVVLPFGNTIERDGTHPKVYVGLGGHASYPFPGLSDVPTILGKEPEFHKGDYKVFKPSPEQVHYLPRAGSIKTLQDENAWLLYPGTWGESSFLPGTNAPHGPMFLATVAAPLNPALGDRWLDPWTWSLKNLRQQEAFPTVSGVSSAPVEPFWYLHNDHAAVLSWNKQLSGQWRLTAYDDPDRHLAVVGAEGDDTYRITINSEQSNDPRGIYISDLGGKDVLRIEDVASSSFENKLKTLFVPGDLDYIDFPILSKPRPGKMGIAKVGTTLVIDLNRDGKAELVEGNYAGASDLAIVNFFDPNGGPGSGFIEEFYRWSFGPTERGEYSPIKGEEILSFLAS